MTQLVTVNIGIKKCEHLYKSSIKVWQFAGLEPEAIPTEQKYVQKTSLSDVKMTSPEEPE